MRFGRRRDNDAVMTVLRHTADPAAVALDAKGWVCNADPAHFRQEE
jgi:hypothetical protein